MPGMNVIQMPRYGRYGRGGYNPLARRDRQEAWRQEMARRQQEIDASDRRWWERRIYEEDVRRSQLGESAWMSQQEHEQAIVLIKERGAQNKALKQMGIDADIEVAILKEGTAKKKANEAAADATVTQALGVIKTFPEKNRAQGIKYVGEFIANQRANPTTVGDEVNRITNSLGKQFISGSSANVIINNDINDAAKNRQTKIDAASKNISTKSDLLQAIAPLSAPVAAPLKMRPSELAKYKQHQSNLSLINKEMTELQRKTVTPERTEAWSEITQESLNQQMSVLEGRKAELQKQVNWMESQFSILPPPSSPFSSSSEPSFGEFSLKGVSAMSRTQDATSFNPIAETQDVKAELTAVANTLIRSNPEEYQTLLRIIESGNKDWMRQALEAMRQ